MQKIIPHLWFDKEAVEAAVDRVMQAFLSMKKVNLAALRKAYDGK